MATPSVFDGNQPSVIAYKNGRWPLRSKRGKLSKLMSVRSWRFAWKGHDSATRLRQIVMDCRRVLSLAQEVGLNSARFNCQV
jgi:hypothetical protein